MTNPFKNVRFSALWSESTTTRRFARSRFRPQGEMLETRTVLSQAVPTDVPVDVVTPGSQDVSTPSPGDDNTDVVDVVDQIEIDLDSNQSDPGDGAGDTTGDAGDASQDPSADDTSDPGNGVADGTPDPSPGDPGNIDLDAN